MDIKSLSDVKWVNRKWNLNTPSLKIVENILGSYTVQRGEDMRIDLVMKSIYDDVYTFKDIDIILYINNIDNPINIREGMVLYYPESTSFDGYRYYEETNKTDSKSIKQRLGVLNKPINKTTRVDEKRKKFLDSDYSLPPVVLPESRPSVTMDANKIKIGGL
jgi:hypothetical protein